VFATQQLCASCGPVAWTWERRCQVTLQTAICLLPLLHHLLMLLFFYEWSINHSETTDEAVRQDVHVRCGVLTVVTVGCDTMQSGRSSLMIPRNCTTYILCEAMSIVQGVRGAVSNCGSLSD
jgi:hypothetical protein